MEKEDRHINGSDPDEIVLLRYIQDISPEEEIVLVENWLNSNDGAEKVLLQVAGLDYALRTKKRIESRDPLVAYAKVEKRIRLSHRRFRMSWMYTAAACFLGILILSTAIHLGQQKVSEVTTQIITVQANAGMRTHFNLPDGTVAYLNSGSVLSYPLPYDSNERRVKLTGEAYFKVAHNSEQPFIVSVADDKVRVKVLGTEFNLQAYADEDNIGITLVSGSVLLEVRRNHEITQKVELVPSEKAVFNLHSGDISVQTVNTIYDTAWKEGLLMFKDLPLPQVLKKLSYFYNVTFEVQDPVINSYCFTGTFENKQLSQVLDYLKISSQMDYRIKQVTTDDRLGAQHTTVILKKRNRGN